MTRASWIFLLFALTTTGCGGGGVNVLNGLVATEISSGLSNVDVTSSTDLAPLAAPWRATAEYNLSGITDAEMTVVGIEYLFADICDQPAIAEFRLVRIRGPYSINILTGAVKPPIPAVKAEIDYSLCSVVLLPSPPPQRMQQRERRGGMGRSPAPAGLRFSGQLTDGSLFRVRLPSPPRLEFPSDGLLIDEAKVTVELELPVRLWLGQIGNILEGRPPQPHGSRQPLMIDQNDQPDLTNEISNALARNGSLRRKR